MGHIDYKRFMADLLAAIAVGMTPGALLSGRRVHPILPFCLSWAAFLLAFALLKGNPVGLLTSIGGWIILVIVNGLYTVVTRLGQRAPAR